jgi:hypothetical protein
MQVVAVADLAAQVALAAQAAAEMETETQRVLVEQIKVVAAVVDGTMVETLVALVALA